MTTTSATTAVVSSPLFFTGRPFPFGCLNLRLSPHGGLRGCTMNTDNRIGGRSRERRVLARIPECDTDAVVCAHGARFVWSSRCDHSTMPRPLLGPERGHG